MNYKQVLEYLFSRLPMFQRIGAAAYKADLSNTIAICKHLGDPQNKFRSVHVAGTNGKGSTSHMLASVFQEAGYKTGLYTSPHLLDFRERIRINGNMIPESKIIDFVKKHKEQLEKIQPSFFEWTVGLAFDYFADEKVDIAVIETGLGGRLDSTNVITPELSIITNISYDHQALLGDTLEKIAKEKAGIIKKDVPVVIGERQVEVENVFSERALELDAPIVYASEVFDVSPGDLKDGEREWKVVAGRKSYSLKCPLTGLYQAKNISAVLASVRILSGKFEINETQLQQGIRNVIQNTGLLGRWQILSRKPMIIADTGHNEAGIRQILDGLKELEFKKLHWVLGMVNDKEIDKVLSLLPVFDTVYYFTRASIPRALPAEELAEAAERKGLKGVLTRNVEEALRLAMDRAQQEDLILIGGSTFTVADALHFWKNNFGGF